MPLDYLRSIENESFPLQTTDVHAVDCIRVLLAAEMIDAQVLPEGRAGQPALALVNGITPLGRAALARQESGKAPG